jgi:hypothetical protein
MPHELVVQSPVARKKDLRTAAAVRPPDLNGKVVGLYWNGKQGGDAALEQIAESLRAEYPDVITKKMYLRYYPLKEYDLDLLARECDLVVGTTGD